MEETQHVPVQKKPRKKKVKSIEEEKIQPKQSAISYEEQLTESYEEIVDAILPESEARKEISVLEPLEVTHPFIETSTADVVDKISKTVKATETSEDTYDTISSSRTTVLKAPKDEVILSSEFEQSVEKIDEFTEKIRKMKATEKVILQEGVTISEILPDNQIEDLISKEDNKEQAITRSDELNTAKITATGFTNAPRAVEEIQPIESTDELKVPLQSNLIADSIIGTQESIESIEQITQLTVTEIPDVILEDHRVKEIFVKEEKDKIGVMERPAVESDKNEIVPDEIIESVKKPKKKKVAFKIEDQEVVFPEKTLEESKPLEPKTENEVEEEKQIMDTDQQNLQKESEKTKKVESEITVKKKKKKPLKKKDYEEWIEPEYTPPVLEPMPEKIQWEPKKKKEKSKISPELQKLVPQKIERTEIKSIKLKITEPAEELQFATIKLKKTAVPKRRESKSAKVPKIRLKSRITFISDWPTPLQIPAIELLEENPLQNGVLSRNIEEAETILKKKHKKKKLPDKETTDLEKLDKEFEELKKKPLEKIDDKSIYEKPVKQPKEKIQEKPKELKIGKGKIPEKEELPEDIRLRKIPSKEDQIDEVKPKKPKREEKPDQKEKKDEEQPEFTLKTDNFEPSDIEKIELEKYQPQKEEKPDDEQPQKEPEKYKRPDRKQREQDIEQIPIIKGKPKPIEPEDAPDVKFRIPARDKPEDEPEKITLKPWVKDKSETEDHTDIKPELELRVPTSKIDEDVIKDKKPKKKKKSLIDDQSFKEPTQDLSEKETHDAIQENVPDEQPEHRHEELPKDIEKVELDEKPKKPKKKKPTKKKDYEEWVEPEYTPPVLEPMPEKIQWEPKKKKEKSKISPELQKLVPQKIERKEFKPMKLKISKPLEELQFATIKLKKTAVPKRRESKSTNVPKIRLKSRITFISDWPTPLQIPVIELLEENPLQNGILSRNIEEAETILKKKHKKKKLPDKETTDLEKLDKEFEELKKKPLEKIDDKSIYEKPIKQPKEKIQEKPKKLKIGKGKIPEKEESPEDIRLRKIPSKEDQIDEEKPKKPKREEKPDQKEKKDDEEPEFTLKTVNFEPSDIEKIELEKYQPQKEEKPDDEQPKKESEKYKRPDRKQREQDIEQIPIIKGKPKTKEPEDEPDVKFRIPTRDKPEDEPEKIILKPWTKTTPLTVADFAEDDKLMLEIPRSKSSSPDLENIKSSKNKGKLPLDRELESKDIVVDEVISEDTDDIKPITHTNLKHRKSKHVQDLKTPEGEFLTTLCIQLL